MPTDTPHEEEPFGTRVMRFLDEQDAALEAARSIANDEHASKDDRSRAIAELDSIRQRLEHRAPTHIDRLLNFALDPTVDPSLKRVSRQWFIDMKWIADGEFSTHTKAELRARVVEIMKSQGRWPDDID